jgi:hypothetical protein
MDAGSTTAREAKDRDCLRSSGTAASRVNTLSTRGIGLAKY